MFIMKRLVKNYGNTLVIVFSKEDQEIYNIKEGDVVDLGDIVIIKNKKKEKKK